MSVKTICSPPDEYDARHGSHPGSNDRYTMGPFSTCLTEHSNKKLLNSTKRFAPNASEILDLESRPPVLRCIKFRRVLLPSLSLQSK